MGRNHHFHHPPVHGRLSCHGPGACAQLVFRIAIATFAGPLARSFHLCHGFRVFRVCHANQFGIGERHYADRCDREA